MTASGKNGNDGIFVEAGSTGNVFRRNKLRHNDNFDAEDLNTGLPTGTDGTGNTWEENNCKTDNHNGRLCRRRRCVSGPRVTQKKRCHD